jgi:hypothetical protein
VSLGATKEYAANQGDQNWVVYFGHFSDHYRNSPQFWATFFKSKDYLLSLTKKWVGLQFWLFFRKLIWSPCRQCHGGIQVQDPQTPVVIGRGTTKNMQSCPEFCKA